jgi:hypothetical protein
VDIAKRSLPSTANPNLVTAMMSKIALERDAIRHLMKLEVEKLMYIGAQTTGMTYFDRSSNLQQPCTKPKHMRHSFIQDSSSLNIKRIHWIFHHLPNEIHQDILMNRQTHGNWTVAKGMKYMNMAWAPKREGETSAHTNCIVHLYSRMMSEKRHNVIHKNDGNIHNMMPFVRNPKNMKGKTMYYCQPPIGALQQLVRILQ